MRVKISKQMLAQANKSAMKKSAVLRMENLTPNVIASQMIVSKDPFLLSVEWKKLRKRVIEKYGARCMKCGATPKSLSQINIDHIRPRKLFPDLALDFDNLQVLCCWCNKEKGNKNQNDYRPTLG